MPSGPLGHGTDALPRSIGSPVSGSIRGSVSSVTPLLLVYLFVSMELFVFLPVWFVWWESSFNAIGSWSAGVFSIIAFYVNWLSPPDNRSFLSSISIYQLLLSQSLLETCLHQNAFIVLVYPLHHIHRFISAFANQSLFLRHFIRFHLNSKLLNLIFTFGCFPCLKFFNAKKIINSVLTY